MAKVMHEPETQNGQESQFARFQRAMKTILQVPKEEVLNQEKRNEGAEQKLRITK